MSQVLEVSEGIPQDGQIFELPQQSQDNGEPRYITIMGSLIDPITANERPRTRAGGIEIGNPCLNVVKHFVRKGRITPVLKDAHDPINADVWEKATGRDASYFQQPMPKGYVVPTNEYGNPSKLTPMMRKVAFPGDQIHTIVNGPHNVRDRARWGVVELKTLKGQPYVPEKLSNGVDTDKAIWQMQTTIFPTWPVLPILLDDLERLLDDATVHTYLRPITDEYYTSLNQFRDRARATVEQTHYTMRESAAKSPTGYIPRYVDLDFVLLEQLGMARQDINIRQSAPVAPAADTDLREALKQLIALQIEEKQANIDREKRLVGSENETPPSETENTMAAAMPIPEEVKMWTCEHCGDEMKASAQGIHLGRWCPTLHPKMSVDSDMVEE